MNLNNAGPIAIIGGILWLLYQYFRNKYFTSVVVKDTAKEAPIDAAIAADAQKTQDDKTKLEDAENVLKNDLSDTPSTPIKPNNQ